MTTMHSVADHRLWHSVAYHRLRHRDQSSLSPFWTIPQEIGTLRVNLSSHEELIESLRGDLSRATEHVTLLNEQHAATAAKMSEYDAQVSAVTMNAVKEAVRIGEEKIESVQDQFNEHQKGLVALSKQTGELRSEVVIIKANTEALAGKESASELVMTAEKASQEVIEALRGEVESATAAMETECRSLRSAIEACEARLAGSEVGFEDYKRELIPYEAKKVEESKVRDKAITALTQQVGGAQKQMAVFGEALTKANSESPNPFPHHHRLSGWQQSVIITFPVDFS